MSQPKLIVTSVKAMPLFASFARARAGPAAKILRAAAATRCSSARAVSRRARVSG